MTAAGKPRGRPRKEPDGADAPRKRDNRILSSVLTPVSDEAGAKRQIVMTVEPWYVFFAERIAAAPFVPYDLDFDLECAEIRAHLSRDAYLDFYGKNGGEFWARLSMALQPEVIVEIGTGFGLRTNLIGKLNPGAQLISFDTLSPYPLNDLRVETGYMARLNRTPFEFVHGSVWQVMHIQQRGGSWAWERSTLSATWVTPNQFNLCFIDGSHDADDVLADTAWAWENRDPARFCIVWDDYDLPGPNAAVRGLCEAQGVELHVDGTTAWVGSEDWLR